MYQQNAGGKLITIKKIDTIKEFNKDIYENSFHTKSKRRCG